MDNFTQKITTSLSIKDRNKDDFVHKLFVTANGVTECYNLMKGCYTIGRDDDNDIQILQNTVSRKHAVIHVEDDGISFLKDNGSVNETFRNGVKLKKEIMYELTSGNEIMFGDVACKYLFEAEKDLNERCSQSPSFSCRNICDDETTNETLNFGSESLFDDDNSNMSDIIPETDEENNSELNEGFPSKKTDEIDCGNNADELKQCETINLNNNATILNNLSPIVGKLNNSIKHREDCLDDTNNEIDTTGTDESDIFHCFDDHTECHSDENNDNTLNNLDKTKINYSEKKLQDATNCNKENTVVVIAIHDCCLEFTDRQSQGVVLQTNCCISDNEEINKNSQTEMDLSTDIFHCTENTEDAELFISSNNASSSSDTSNKVGNDTKEQSIGIRNLDTDLKDIFYCSQENQEEFPLVVNNKSSVGTILQELLGDSEIITDSQDDTVIINHSNEIENFDVDNCTNSGMTVNNQEKDVYQLDINVKDPFVVVDDTWMNFGYTQENIQLPEILKKPKTEYISKLINPDIDSNEPCADIKPIALKSDVHKIKTIDIDANVEDIHIKECRVVIDTFNLKYEVNTTVKKVEEAIQHVVKSEFSNIPQNDIYLNKNPFEVDNVEKFREPFVYVNRSNNADDCDFIDRLNNETNTDEILTQRLTNNPHIDLTFSTPDSIYDQPTQQIDDYEDPNIINTQVVQENNILPVYIANDYDTQPSTQVIHDDYFCDNGNNVQDDMSNNSNVNSQLATQVVLCTSAANDDNRVCTPDICHYSSNILSEAERYTNAIDEDNHVCVSTIGLCNSYAMLEVVSDIYVNVCHTSEDYLDNNAVQLSNKNCSANISGENMHNTSINVVTAQNNDSNKAINLSRNNSPVVHENVEDEFETSMDLSFFNKKLLNVSTESIIDSQLAENIKHNNSLFKNISNNYNDLRPTSRKAKVSLSLKKTLDKNTQINYQEGSDSRIDDGKTQVPNEKHITNNKCEAKKTSKKSISNENKKIEKESSPKKLNGRKKVSKDNKKPVESIKTITTRSNMNTRKKLINVDEINLQIFDVENSTPPKTVYHFSDNNEQNISINIPPVSKKNYVENIKSSVYSDDSSEVKIIIPNRNKKTTVSDKLVVKSKPKTPKSTPARVNKEDRQISKIKSSVIDVSNIITRKRKIVDPVRFIDSIMSQRSSKSMKLDLSMNADEDKNCVMIERTRQGRRSSLLTLSNSPSMSGKCQNIIMFSGIVDQNYEKIVKKLNGDITKDVGLATHMVCNKMRRTVNFMCCVVRGVQIVTPDWLTACNRLKYFIPTDSYILKTGCDTFNVDLKMSLQSARRAQTRCNGILGHYRYVVFVTNNTKPSPKELETIISYAGGTFVLLSDPHFQDYLDRTNVRHICVANEMDLKKRNKEINARITMLTEKDIDIVTVEFLFAIVLDQRHPELKNYKFDV